MNSPTVQYAQNGDVHIAYRVLGDGPLDLVLVAGALTRSRRALGVPDYRRACERLSSFARLITFDKRGMGLSDRVRVGTLEERMDDVRAILDAVGSESAALLGISEGGPMCDALRRDLSGADPGPRAVRRRGQRGDDGRLALGGGDARGVRSGDGPDRVVERWGQGLVADFLVPSRKGDPQLRELFGRLQVQSATPHDAIAFMRMAFEIDVRHVAPLVRAPTLIIHRVGDRICAVGNARWLAEHIEGARYVELPGDAHLPWTDGEDEILDEIQEFLTGVREPAAPDRMLATVLFTDVVGSTDRARELGDRRWRDLLERHNEVIRRDLERFRGVEIDTAGDGFFATFDGPARAIRCARSIVESVRERRPRRALRPAHRGVRAER